MRLWTALATSVKLLPAAEEGLYDEVHHQRWLWGEAMDIAEAL